jgi:PAT family beta-lactamase induction signal transducer AmpG
MSMTRTLPPVWLLGMANLPFGIFGAVMLITVPQLLAARGVSEPQIAAVTAFALIPGFCAFVLSPVLDVRFSRRAYALFFALCMAICSFAALVDTTDLAMLRVLLFVGFIAGVLFNGALGGWLGSVIGDDSDSAMGAWFTVANIGGFGVMAVLAILLLRDLPAPLGAALLALFMLAPTIIFLFIPAPPSDRRLAAESYAAFGRDILALLRRKTVLRALLLFAMPTAAFALTNQLGGLGNVYGASENFVSLVAGFGVTIAGVIGSLAVPRIAKRFSPRLLYLLIGSTGAIFTLCLIALPRSPLIFAVAMIGENVFQSASFSTQFGIIFDSVGRNNPLAATQFAFLTAAGSFPIAYMQAIDGAAYASGGLAGSYLVDAGLSLGACMLLLPLVISWRDRPQCALPVLSE